MTDTIAAAVERLRVAARRFGDFEAPSFGPPCCDADLVSIRGTVSAEVLVLLKIHRSIVAMQIHNGYWIGGSATGQFRLPSEPGRASLDAGPTDVLTIATDGGGNAFVQRTTGGPIWRWNHETARTHLAAPSLADFIDAVAEDWTHFAAGESWPFLVSEARYRVPPVDR